MAGPDWRPIIIYDSLAADDKDTPQRASHIDPTFCNEELLR